MIRLPTGLVPLVAAWGLQSALHSGLVWLQSSPGAIDKLAAAGAERMKALGDKKRTDAKKRKDERTAEAPAKKHKGDEVVAPAAKAKTDAKTAAEGKAAKVPAAKAGKAARGKAARGNAARGK
ncbi:hypothetical protein CHLRE_04g217650v5 [Chlamydomonas reinhardtii]|uniref:Uncharacterized protein n=1 Tax=Chlamydomonas reinhardtii TaxID=3055 RepID=A0A2K3DTC7_CHLRE|nr:uncharacterized protein CHLRE_04g217650v5 [Chlamydomonas reinhardtii]PNW83791.1 hypothetical protein CHLRE_04g217650v5 [Chlamydomonas reinhardtii]